MKKFELLAPAGNFPMLVAAVNAGADAVYFGLKEFSMRMRTENFNIKDIGKIRKICRSSPRKAKMFLALNTIIYSKEVRKIESILKKVKGKVDAVICWDLAVASLCKKYKIPFFISTQASVANKEAALFYKKLGAERVILARELDLKQVKEISKVINVEAFCHGAMCVAISGRCFMSQFTFGKSANRGECLQNCRRSYIVKDKQGKYEFEVRNNKIFSAKDLCTLPFIEQMKKAGITSFKIEGRNRDCRYVDAVTRVYRKALDKKLSKKEIRQGLNELKKVYNRGFSSGFYLGAPSKKDFAVVDSSAAKEKKHFAGKITNYLSRIGVALVKVSSDIKVGDNIIVIGETTGIINSKIERIEINKKSIEKAVKGQHIGIKLPRARKGDDVYIIKKVL